MTPDWMVMSPGWGKMDEVYLTVRVVDLLDELEVHVIPKEFARPGGRGFMKPIGGPSEVRRRLSKTKLIDPLSYDGYETDSSSCSDSMDELDFDSIETARNTELYGPADPGLDLSTMPRLVI